MDRQDSSIYCLLIISFSPLLSLTLSPSVSAFDSDRKFLCRAGQGRAGEATSRVRTKLYIRCSCRRYIPPSSPGAAAAAADPTMECRATVSRKLGSSFNGTSIYDGVFSGSAPFRPSSFSSSASSRPEDYTEIFGGSRDSRRSSIPVLDVPALHERKVSVDVRSSKLEYSKIFGGGSGDGELSYEDIVVDPRKMRNLSRHEP